MTNTPGIKNALSVDLEDWFHGVLQINFRDWQRYESRLEPNLLVILELLKKHNTQATFFVLGYIAEKFPLLVKMIADGGHEIASHGYHHRLVYEQTREEFRRDILSSREAIKKATGQQVKGYRAPYFSITEKSLWALKVLNELGFDYDSSIFPTKNFLYGIPGAPRTPYRVEGANITEFPLSVIKRGRVIVPVSGGFYMRMLPYKVIKWGISSFNRAGAPAVVYLHPWEIDSEKPKMDIPMSLKWKIIYEGNIRTMKRKFEQLLKDFSFTTVTEALRNRR